MNYRKPGIKEKARTPPGYDRIAKPIPAPGKLEILQAFVNTLGIAAKADALDTPRALSDWMSRYGLLAVGTELTRQDLERARAVRRGLYALLRANNGADIDPAAIDGLDQAVLGARAQVRVDRDGTTRLELVSRDLNDAIGTLLGFVHEAHSSGDWPKFKVCAHPKCRRAFFDFTKNVSGKWCTRRCGERVRSDKYRRSPKYARLS